MGTLSLFQPGGRVFDEGLDQTAFWYVPMVHPQRVKRKVQNGIPHLPFQEFTVPTLDGLLNMLKKARIKNSEIEVSTSEEGQHTTCSKPLVHVLVMSARNVGGDVYRDLCALYQYCPGCGNAVRVL